MADIDTFVIDYDPIERRVHFAVHKSSGAIVDVADGEPLKEYENIDGLFSLEGQYDELFSYIRENFDGRPEISLKVDVSQLGFNKRQAEFERFEKNVKKFNKNSNIKVNLEIDIMRVAPKQEEPSSATDPKVSNAGGQEHKTENIAPIAVKPTMKVAVVGKISSGKTELIAGLTKYKKSTCETTLLPQGTTKYYDSNNDVAWYEIAGIEFGKENVAKAREVLDNLIEADGISIVLYCLNARTGKMEDIERNFIVDVKQKYADVMVYAVITASVDEGGSRSFADRVSNLTKQTKVFTVLAKEMRTNVGFLPPFGLDDIATNIYGV
jgi:hypothetical protein